jgi:hypothetical protein
MKKFRLLLVLVFSMSLFLPVQAKRVDVEKAEKIARSYAHRTPRISTRQDFRHVRTGTKRVHRNNAALRSASQQDEPMYHIFAMNGNGGFIIISGDDVALPVLGYSGEGTYDESNPNLTYWMETLAQEIAWAIENDVQQDEQTKAAWDAVEDENPVTTRASGDYIDPLIETRWNQGAPYNNLCPSSTPTGCVATAMAQIMYYHKHPTTGSGSYSYSHTYGTQSADFGATTYQWSSMTKTYNSNSGTAAKDAVATLMRHCGVSVNMNYGTGGSGANSGRVPNALVTYFGYDAGATFQSRNIYPYTEWVNMLKTELRAGRPVYYGGNGSGGGHAFVCDGYDTDDLFHINWGWGGSSDGYFEISALSPNTLGIGGGAGGFNTDQEMIIGIKPSAGGSLPDIKMGIADFYANKTSLSDLSESFNIIFVNVSNASSVTVNTSIGIWLYNDDDTDISYTGYDSYSYSFPSGSYIGNITRGYTLPGNLQSGTYKLYPAYKPSGQSTPAIISGENGDKCITVTVNSDKSVTLSNGSAVAPSLMLHSLSVDGNLYLGRTGNMKAEIENTGTADYNAQLQIKLNNQPWATDPIVIPAGTTKTVVFSGNVTLSPGNYQASLWYDPDNVQSNSPSARLGNSVSVEVKSTPTGSPSLTVESMTFSPDADNVSIDNLNLTVQIKNTGELYSDIIDIDIYPESGGTNITYFRNSSVIIDKDEIKTLVFNNPLNGILTIGTRYRAYVYANVSGYYIGNYSLFTVVAPSSPSSDATLKTLTVKDAQTSATISTISVLPEQTAYTVNDISSGVTAISIIGEANEARAKFSNVENASFTGNTATYNIMVTADDKMTTENYAITLNRAAAAQYGVNISTFAGGSVATSDNQNSYTAGAEVTLKVKPDAGYELDDISVYQNDGLNTPVGDLSGSGDTYTFTMPACAVTVTATFHETDATLLAEAKTTIEDASPYTVTEATANTEDDVKTWLAAQINALPGMAIETVNKNDFTKNDFSAADLGTNGSFAFTVTLKKNDNSTSASVSGVITATPAYTVTIGNITKGSIQITPDKYHAGETVTPSAVTPDTGYELKEFSAHKTGEMNTPVTINKATGVFTMPAYDVTVIATFRENADQLAVEAAKAAIENPTYTVKQATANDNAGVQAWLAVRIGELPEVSGITVSNIIATVSQVAVEGKAGNLLGTPGQFTFTVDLQKGASTTVTAGKTGTITATQAYNIIVNTYDNGSITPSVTAATAGTPVTLLATPASADYELKTLSVYKTGELGTEVSMLTKNTFEMPDYGVNVAATFDMTAARQNVEIAKRSIENASYAAIPQATANDEPSIKTWLVTQINSLISSTGITISESDINTVSFSWASAGTDGEQSGLSNGSFTFTVSLSASVTVTTGNKTVTITGTPYVAPLSFAIIISGTTNGTVSSSPSGSATENADVTLTITPDPGYELNGEVAVSYQENTSPTVSVTLTGQGNTRYFKMPAHDVTVEAAFKKTADQTDVESAKTAVEKHGYNVMQTTANNDESVERWLSGQISGLLLQAGTGVTATAITLTNSVSPAVKGAPGNSSGTDGAFQFTVSLEKGGRTITTDPITGKITATHAYTITVDNSAISLTGDNIVAEGDPVTFTVSSDQGYEIQTVSVYKTSDDTQSSLLTPDGDDYTFTMPAYDVTVTATFLKTADQLTVERAASWIKNAPYTVSQVTANTEATVETWLVGQINATLSTTGIVVSENEISIDAFTAAQDGKTANQKKGNPGSFDFTVTLQTGNSAPVQASASGSITATQAYDVTVTGSITNGSVTPNPTLALQGEMVTLTIAPASAAYELDYVMAYQTGNKDAQVELSGSEDSRTFMIPAYDVTVEAAFKQTADRVTLESAKNTVETPTYTVTQATANTEAAVWTWLEQELNAALSGTGVTVSGSSASISPFRAAVAGTDGAPSGINGSFGFSVTLNKNGQTLSAGKSDNMITATRYTPLGTYIITIDGTTNGTVTADQYASIQVGTGITLTIQPNSGYELNTFDIYYKDGNTNISIDYAISGNTRTFTMPEHNVIVAVTFKRTADRQKVEEAKAILNRGTFNVAQETADTKPAVESWLLTEISDRIVSTGVTASDITVSNFAAATAGAAGAPLGADGSFDFTVRMTKGDVSLNAELEGKIIATGYLAPSYTVTIAATNGMVIADPPNPVSAGATVTLRLAPDAGYMPGTITICKTGDPDITFNEPSVTGPTMRTFTMPGCDVTVTVAFIATSDQQDVEEAQLRIAAESYTIAQSDANTSPDVRDLLMTQIADLINTTGVTVSDITIDNFTVATAGTAGSPSGTNGSFSFTVDLTKGGSSLTTPTHTGVITATAYSASTYTITVVAPTNGSVTVNPSGTVGAGANITLTIAPATGYGLASISVYRTDAPATTVTLGGSGNTRTFAMPAYDVTIEATFLPMAQLMDQQDVDNVRSLIEGATFSVSQAMANTSSDVLNWLVQQLNRLTGTTGVTVSGIAFLNFTTATAGSATSPNGTNGSFTFTVSLVKNSATAVTSAKTGQITATAYTPPAQYDITVKTSSNGSVTANVTSAQAGATVTLTATPEAGYEPDVIRVYRTTDPSSTIALTGTGLTRTFTMPAYDVTVEATFRKTQDQVNMEIVEAVKTSIEGGMYRIAQATGNTEATVKSWLTNVLNLLLSGRNAVITLRSDEAETLTADVTLTAFMPAVGGTEENPEGVNGSFRFAVALAKGSAHAQTLDINGVVVAMPYIATPIKRIELLPIGEMRVRIINTGNLATGDLTVTLSGANAQAFTLSSAAPGDLATGGETDITLIPVDGLPVGVYTATVTVSGEDLTPASIDITYRVLSTGNGVIAAHHVWATGNTLYIAASTAGEARVFSIGGQLVKIVSHTAGETAKVILSQGLYIVIAEGETYKITIN